MRLVIVFFCLIVISVPAWLFTGCGTSGGSDETTTDTTGNSSGKSVSDSFSISGEGTKNTSDDNFYCTGGSVEFQYNHTGDRSFTVSLVDGLTGIPIVILASGSAGFDGYNSLDLPAKEYYFDITADGGWTITVAGNCWMMSELVSGSAYNESSTEVIAEGTTDNTTESDTDGGEPETEEEEEDGVFYVIYGVPTSQKVFRYGACCPAEIGIYGCLTYYNMDGEFQEGYILCNDGTEVRSCECPN